MQDSAKTTKLYDELGIEPPSHEEHGSDEDIRNRMVKLLPNQWRLQGNMLIGQTDMGELAQRIDPGYVLTSTSESGMPVFQKISIQ